MESLNLSNNPASESVIECEIHRDEEHRQQELARQAGFIVFTSHHRIFNQSVLAVMPDGSHAQFWARALTNNKSEPGDSHVRIASFQAEGVQYGGVMRRKRGLHLPKHLDIPPTEIALEDSPVLLTPQNNPYLKMYPIKQIELPENSTTTVAS